MAISPREIGQDPQSKALWGISKQIEKLLGIIFNVGNNPGMQLTSDELNAIQDSNSPSSGNVFATIDDVPTALADLSEDSTHRVVTDVQIATWNPKKLVYTVWLTQTSTNAPIATVIEDTLTGGVWAYSAVGTYTFTKTGAFTANKTVPDKTDAYTDASGNLYTLERTSANIMTLKTYAAADTTILANGVLSGQYLNIEIYL